MERTTAQFTRLAILLLATTVACKSADKTAAAAADSAHTAAGVNVGGAQTQPQIPLEVRVALDSGNVLFTLGSSLDKKNAKPNAIQAYTGALAQYRIAARAAGDNAAPMVGVYMAALALGDKVLADSAYADLQKRGAAPVPGAMHSASPPPAKVPGKVHGQVP